MQAPDKPDRVTGYPLSADTARLLLLKSAHNFFRKSGSNPKKLWNREVRELLSARVVKNEKFME